MEASFFTFLVFFDGSKPELLVTPGYMEVISCLRGLGFTDTAANIYIEKTNPKSFYVFDTEMGSFDQSTWVNDIKTAECNRLLLEIQEAAGTLQN